MHPAVLSSAPFHQVFAERIKALNTNDAYSAVRAEMLANFAEADIPPDARPDIIRAFEKKIEEFKAIAASNANGVRFNTTIETLRRGTNLIMRQSPRPNGAVREHSSPDDFRRRGHHTVL